VIDFIDAFQYNLWAEYTDLQQNSYVLYVEYLAPFQGMKTTLCAYGKGLAQELLL